jgi:Spy/CpxP family protein refolding chaperone
MRKAWFVGLTLLAVLAAAGVVSAQPRWEGPQARFSHPAVGQPGYVAALLLIANDIGLTSDQVERLKSIASSFEKEAAKVGADLRVANIELREMLDRKGANIADLEAKIKQIESLQSGLRLSMIKAQLEAKGFLTDEQLTKLESIRTGQKHLHGHHPPRELDRAHQGRQDNGG